MLICWVFFYRSYIANAILKLLKCKIIFFVLHGFEGILINRRYALYSTVIMAIISIKTEIQPTVLNSITSKTGNHK